VQAESSRAAEERARARAALEAPMPTADIERENGHVGTTTEQPPLAFLSQDPARDLEAAKTPQRLKHSTSRASLPATPRTPTVPASAIDVTPSTNLGRPDTAPEDAGEEEFPWGPLHPCFPHMNPHVPLSSPEYTETRIIRVRRDWMQVGDLAPTFANLYPEVLDPLVSEDEFRRVLQHVNNEVIAALTPWSARAWLDAAMGVATLWLWDDLGLAGVKTRLAKLEAWIERWNRDVGAQDGVKIIPLRRTAYLTVCHSPFLTAFAFAQTDDVVARLPDSRSSYQPRH